MIISGHTHQPYVCSLPDPNGQPRLITSASSFGRLFNETDVTYDRRTSDIVRPTTADSRNMLVTQTVAKDPAETALIATYSTLVKAIADKVLGQIVGTSVSKTQNAAGESPLGDLIADAQLADPSVVTGGKTPVVAFMNPGGIRSDLVADANGNVTYQSAFTVQPFNNYLVSMDITGQGIYDLLGQQFSGANSAGSPKVLQVSSGFTYSYTQLGKGTPHVRRHGDRRRRLRQDQRRAGRQGRHLPDRHQQLPLRWWRRLPGLQGGHRQVLRWARHRRLRGLPHGALAVHAARPEPHHEGDGAVVPATPQVPVCRRARSTAYGHRCVRASVQVRRQASAVSGARVSARSGTRR